MDIKTTWTYDSLTACDIQQIYCRISKRDAETKCCQVDVDVINVMCIIARDKIYSDAMNKVAVYLKRLAHFRMFFVTVILDGITIPDCKRALFKRTEECETNKINVFFAVGEHFLIFYS